MSTDPQVGDFVKIRPSHPFRGHQTGTIYELAPRGRYVVRFAAGEYGFPIDGVEGRCVRFDQADFVKVEKP